MSTIEIDNLFNYHRNDVAKKQRTVDGELFSTYSSSHYDSMSRNHRFASNPVGGRDDHNEDLQCNYNRFAESNRDNYRGTVADDGRLGERGGGNYNYPVNYRDYPPPERSPYYFDNRESGTHDWYPHHPQKSLRGYENDRPCYHHRPNETTGVYNRNGSFRNDEDYYHSNDHVGHRNRNTRGIATNQRIMNARQVLFDGRKKEADEQFNKSEQELFSCATIQEILNGENPVESYEEYAKESGRQMYGLKQDDLFDGSNHVKQDPYQYLQYKQVQGNNVPFKTVERVMPGDAYSQSIERKLRENDKGGGGGGGYTSSGKPTAQHTPMLEIAPGVYARLRTAQETMEAISRDFYIPSECFCCSLTIFCIQDADYVLCPECRVISRNGDGGGDFDEYEDGGGDKKKSAAGGGKDGGVGLGFTLDELAEWQADAERRMATTSNNSGAHDDRYNSSYRY